VFAVFFPHDAHKPSCDWEGKRKLRKVVVKVAV
jgi:beta-galactosidase beta subunit